MEGKFVVLEGVDYSGKTSLGNRLTKHLNDKGLTTVLVNELLSTLLGREIKNLFAKERRDYDYETETLLFLATKKELINKVIKPKLEEGINVICDRYIISTMIYSILDNSFIYRLHRLTVNDLSPDLTIFIDVDPDIILSREHACINDKGRMDTIAANPDLTKIIKAYRKFYENKDSFFLYSAARRITRIDGNCDMENLVKRALDTLIIHELI